MSTLSTTSAKRSDHLSVSMLGGMGQVQSRNFTTEVCDQFKKTTTSVISSTLKKVLHSSNSDYWSWGALLSI